LILQQVTPYLSICVPSYFSYALNSFITNPKLSSTQSSWVLTKNDVYMWWKKRYTLLNADSLMYLEPWKPMEKSSLTSQPELVKDKKMPSSPWNMCNLKQQLNIPVEETFMSHSLLLLVNFFLKILLNHSNFKYKLNDFKPMIVFIYS
jgi:hypothetical protein